MSASERAREAIFQIVENQLEADDPPLVKVTLERLVKSGFSRPEAISHIASALVIEIDGALRNSEVFNLDRYNANLKKLPNLEWDVE